MKFEKLNERKEDKREIAHCLHYSDRSLFIIT